MILNIVIPTFNRYEILFMLLNELTKIRIENLIISIHDSSYEKMPTYINELVVSGSILYYKYDGEISGSKKYLSALGDLTADYNLLLNDRDFYSWETIYDLTMSLKTVESFSLGKLIAQENNRKLKSRTIKNKNRILSELLHFGTHPTGWIFSKEFLTINSTVIDSLLQLDKQFLYPHIQSIVNGKFINCFTEFFYNPNYFELSIANKNLSRTISLFTPGSDKIIKWVDPFEIGSEIGSMVCGIINNHSSSLSSPVVFNYIFLGAKRVTHDRKNVYSKNSNFLVHHGVNSNTYSKKQLRRFYFDYIKTLESIILEHINFKYKILKFYLSLRVFLIIEIPLISRVPSGIMILIYRLQRKVMILCQSRIFH